MPASASSKTNLADVLVTSATRLRYYETAVQLSFDARKPRVVESPSRRTCNQLIRFRSHRGCLNKSVAAYNAVEFCPRVCLSVCLSRALRHAVKTGGSARWKAAIYGPSESLVGWTTVPSVAAMTV